MQYGCIKTDKDGNRNAHYPGQIGHCQQCGSSRTKLAWNEAPKSVQKLFETQRTTTLNVEFMGKVVPVQPYLKGYFEYCQKCDEYFLMGGISQREMIEKIFDNLN